jgi:hypothetical protein
LLLLTATVLLVVPAAASVTVHVADAPGATFVGEQVIADKVAAGAACNETVAVLLTPLRLAVTTAFCVEVTDPAVAWKDAEVAPVATVTEAGTPNRVELLASCTVVFATAALLRVTVQAPAAWELIDAGHVIPLRTGVPVAGCREIVSDFVTPLNVAVTTAL